MLHLDRIWGGIRVVNNSDVEASNAVVYIVRGI